MMVKMMEGDLLSSKEQPNKKHALCRGCLTQRML